MCFNLRCTDYNLFEDIYQEWTFCNRSTHVECNINFTVLSAKRAVRYLADNA